MLTVSLQVAECIVKSLSTHVAEYLRRRWKERDRHPVEVTARQLNARTLTENTRRILHVNLGFGNQKTNTSCLSGS